MDWYVCWQGRRLSEGCLTRKPHNKVTSEQAHEDREEGRSHVTIWRTFQTTGMEVKERNRLHREMPLTVTTSHFLSHKALGCFRPQLHGFK